MSTTKERPILFSGAMVRALLDGSKTQTRRVVKPRIAETLEWFGGKADADDDRELDELLGQRTEEKGLRVWCHDYPEEGSEVIRCPYGQPGEQIWVREAWRASKVADELKPSQLVGGSCSPVWYEAQDEVPFHPSEFGKLRPSMFMPRWASRITLEITSVRVERLQDISETDAKAEGIRPNEVRQAWLFGATPTERAAAYRRAAVEPYHALWEQINGPDSWAANPWVWAIEFRRLP